MMHKVKPLHLIRVFSTYAEQKPFETIPAPKRWPIVGHLHLFSKFGPYSLEEITDAWRDLNAKYGSIVSLDIGVKTVLLFDPEDIKQLFRNEGKLPSRPVFEVLQHYRRSHPNMYSSAGLVTENGENWWKIRRTVNWMLRPDSVNHFLSQHEKLTDDFIGHVRNIRNNKNDVHNLLTEIYKYTLEAGALLCLGRRFGALEGKDNNGIFQAVHDTLDSMMKTLLGLPVWKIAKTPTYKRLERAQNILYRVIIDNVENAKQWKDSKKTNCVFLDKLMGDSQLDSKDITVTVLEMLLASIDATGNTISFLLYHLAKNPNAQEKLYAEIKDVKDFSNMAKLSYLKQCLKENNRLTPTTGATARILSQELMLSGYKVPAGVLCLGLHPIIGRMKEYFSEPEKFIPERWLRDGGRLTEEIHPYALLPFGHGVRRCIGQRFAEQEIYMMIAKLVQNFKIEFPYGEIGYIQRLQMMPDRPLTFRFTDRSR